MPRPVIHLCAPASPGKTVLDAFGLDTARDLIGHVQEIVGPAYRVGGRPSLIDGFYDEKDGGRHDDTARARELEQVLANDDVVALVAVRGGGWLTRVLPHVDFRALDSRRRPVAIFGFSEITTLVNLVGAHPRGLGCYYMTPGFARIGTARYARLHAKRLAPKTAQSGRRLEQFADRWARRRFDSDVRAYFRDLVRILEGRPPGRQLIGRLVAGRLPANARATVLGGCLSLVTPLTTAAYHTRIDPRRKWIALEDLEEAPHRIDRQFAHIKLAGWFEKCAGVLLGDFHSGDEDQSAEALAILRYHLPRQRSVPVIASRDFGHTWPQSILPIGRPLTLRVRKRGRGAPRVTFEAPWARWKVT